MTINPNNLKSLFQRLKNAGNVINNANLHTLTKSTVRANSKAMTGVGNALRRIGNDLGNSGLPNSFDFGDGVGTVGENLKYLPRAAALFDSTGYLDDFFDQYKY